MKSKTLNKCIPLIFLWMALHLPWVASAQMGTVITIGDTNNMFLMSGDATLPYVDGWASYTQQLVQGNELNGEAMITGIDFYCSTTSSARRPGCTIYLANTYVPNMGSGMVGFGPLSQQVAVDTMVCTAGWNHYEFDTAFYYNGLGNLLIAVDCPWGWTGANYYVAQRGMTESRYARTNLANFTSSTSTTSSPCRNIMRLHTQPVSSTVAACPAPTMWVDSAGSTAVKMKWNPGYRDTMWTVECITDGDTAWHTSGLVWGDTSYTMTGLTPNSNYTFRLTAFCTDTFTTVWKRVLTNCVPTALPYAENLESAWGVPSCWYASPGAVGDRPAVTTRYTHTGSRAMQLYGGAVVLPAFDAPADSLELYFWAKSGGGSVRNLYVGLVTDPLDLSTFVPLDTVVVPNYTNWVPVAVRTDRYPWEAGRLAIVTADPLNPWMYIDDIEVSHIVPCEALAPATLDWKTDTAALVRWTDTAGAVYYDVAYGPAGFVPDSTTIVTDVRTDSLLLTGLLPYTQYEVYVRPECGSFTTHWSPVMMFRTLCSLLDTLHYTDNFDSYSVATRPTAIPCWQGRVGMNTYVVNLAGDAHSGTQVMRWEWSIYETVVDQKIVLPAINTAMLPMNRLQLSFWAKNIENLYDRYDPARVVVGVMDDPAVDSTLQVIDTLNIVGNEWTRYDVPLTAYRGTGKYIAMLSCPGIGSHNSWYAYVDDVLIDLAPPCANVTGMTVTGITSTSVTVEWDAADSGTRWQAFVDSTATATPVADTSVLTSPTYTFSGLVAEQPYYVWVRAICPKGDTSGWEGPMQIVPGTWNMRANKSDTLTMCGVSLYDNGGATDVFSDQTSQMVILPDMPGHLVKISGLCDIGGSSTLTVYDGVGTSGSVLWNKTINNSYAVNFGPVISETGALMLYFHGWTPFNLYYDGFELQVSCVPDTCIIHHLQLDTSVPASDSTIALTWQCNGASHYEVEYGPVGFAPGSGTIVGTATNHYTITGLTSLARREVRVRSICGTYDTGAWVSGIFNTQPCNDAVYRENFDSTLGIGTHPGVPIGFNGSEYSLAQTLVDSAFLAGLEGGITALAFHPTDNVVGDHHSRVTVYLANVPDTAFAGGPIMPDAGHRFVKVIDSANLNHLGTSEWQPIPFDHPFMWDGRQNLLVTVLDEDGAAGMRTEYASHFRYDDLQNRVNRSYVIYSDWPINIDSLANTTTNMSYGNWSTGDLRLYTNTCDLPLCAVPVINSVVTDHESATITWSGTSDSYQLSVTGAGLVSLTDNSYTLTGLQPSTTYSISIRQNCTVDSLGYSDWVTINFTTDTFTCPSPSDLTVYDVTNSSATLDWISNEDDSLWQLDVWITNGWHTSLQVDTHPFSMTELIPATTYNASVHGYCGSEGQIATIWSDTVQFTTLTCPRVTGLDTADVTANSVTLVWDADTMAQDYLLRYGTMGVWDDGVEDSVITGNSCVIVGLQPATSYSFYVRTRCADDWLATSYDSLVNVVTRREVGIREPQAQFQFTLQPNPAKGATTVQIMGLPSKLSGTLHVTVADLTGRDVLSRNLECDGQCQLSLNIEGLPAGAYFVRIVGEQGTAVRKLIVAENIRR